MRKTNYSKELIDDAIYLYNDIDSITNDIVHARLNNDEEAKKKAISRMETAMCAVFQFLKCLIERKDNIVDLGEVWHDIKEEPLVGNTIVYLTKNHAIGTLKRVNNHRFSWYIEKYAICKWAYMKDLLPKGGEQWNTTK